MKNGSKLIYLDHAAITPIRPEVWEVMKRVYREAWGNPSSIHAFGRIAKKELDRARQVMQDTVFAGREGQVIFTSGGTESNALALWGTAQPTGVRGMHIISQPTEHVSVLNTLRALEQQGAEVTWLPVDEFGLVDVEELKRALRPETALVSIMTANNEIGTVQPIAELVRAAKAKLPNVVFHTDACQAAGILDLTSLGPVDLISLTGTKLGGPHAGALWVRSGLSIAPQQLGGGQEFGVRSGTEAVPEIAGLARAVQLAHQERAEKSKQLTTWREELKTALLSLPDSRLNGHPTHRLPQNLHLSFTHLSGETLLVSLDQAGVAASTGSACAAGSIEESHVLRAIRLPKTYIHGSLRVTLGWSTTEKEVQAALKLIPKVIKDLHKTA